jgi:isoleucyl-tRNA synthetase
VAKVLEPMRAAGEIGAALDAEITLACNADDRRWLAPFVDELRFMLISGDVSIVADDDAHEITVLAQPTQKPKCVRCWHHRADVGSDAAHPQLCRRCVSNIEGPGEDRKWF